MKDLKHLLYFENLLQEAQNELILQAQSEGDICVAYVCENTPEPLLNLPGAFSTRLRRVRRCGRLAAAHPHGLLPVRHLQ